ncbi:MAG: tRNA (guanine-N(7)-)-methyltransferase non-catalytic subunit trm82 [Pycnora praestabilis]|nr:MAG: tRNA (guanine-N(7)-)-methyltransferase non-catalytic subunit trm82 [Pycnora praestabilis]
MNMQHPFQCLRPIFSKNTLYPDILLAAAGPQIYSFSLEDGRLMSTWSQARTISPDDSTWQIDRGIHNPSIDGGDPEVSANSRGKAEKAEPPGKRQKLSPRNGEPEGHDAGKRTTAASSPSIVGPSAVVKLICSHNHGYAVAVTGTDKCIRVFEIDGKGCLHPLSERYMPKRPCAIVITSDDGTILCADKFGDVYSLPLLPPDLQATISETKSLQQNIQGEPPGPRRVFVPAATNLTVHTARNQQALKNQMKATNQSSRKTGLDFEHELLLGHVSMLTDLTFSTLDIDAKPRNYILTSDRDEHIRISRGLPQAHIIEGYCLGHTQFVSKLCIPSLHRGILVSGGGDDYLVIWRWIDGQILQKVNIRNLVENAVKAEPRQEENGMNRSPEYPANEGTITSLAGHSVERGDQGIQVAVSGIWDVHTSFGSRDQVVLVASEGFKPQSSKDDHGLSLTMMLQYTLALLLLAK